MLFLHNQAVAKYVAGNKRSLLGLIKALIHISRCSAALGIREEAVLLETAQHPASAAAHETLQAVEIADTVPAPSWEVPKRGKAHPADPAPSSREVTSP